ncbi:CHASE2 domain-containing protein [Magnetospira sp. QH-2]|uniref:CHASE2 domain-containing protein n=1 Tax=Magnetospira sp. (strain QH-2) TaxID=1288970 RepID=UPI0003E80C30|nr:CHASE2 domain-containing protein [Magnetospira sp. QH-2]CCQ72578.1 Guanylate cyclase:CHASE2 [Magnetospira sp. QH-2]
MASKSSRQRWLSAILLIVIVLPAALAGWALPRYVPLLAALENRLADLRVATLAPSLPPHERIILATLTEETLARFPYRSPVDRGFLADLLTTLQDKGAAAVGLDILLDQPTESAKDSVLRRVVANLQMPFIAAYATEQDQLTAQQAAYLDEFLSKDHRALVNLMRDRVDGAVRWVYPGGERNGTWVPGFVAALAASQGTTPPKTVQPMVWRQPPGPDQPAFKRFPAHAMGFLPADWIEGKIVLIGVDLPFEDRHRTPFSGFRDGPGDVPGVAIHAHALAQVLDGSRPTGREDWAAWMVIALGALLGLLLARPSWSMAPKVLGGLAALATGWVILFALYATLQWQLPLIGPSAAYVLAFGVTLAFMADRMRKQKMFVEGAFSRYVDPAVVKELVADPTKLALGGERREITSLFTDLAGFTSMIEQRQPGEVVPLLNSYLDRMCRIATDHGGTIDKIIGDAVSVLFGAPLDQPDHAQRAVDCALAMQAFAESFAQRQQDQGIPFGHTRIGINTGSALVGNFGGEVFFDYTAHGDTINTAARLEGANKYFGTRICVAETTRVQCRDLVFRPIGSVVLKGKTQGLMVHEPLTIEQAAAPAVAAYLEAFQAMEKDQDGLPQLFADIAQRHPDDTLIAYHARRLAEGGRGMTIVLEGK